MHRLVALAALLVVAGLAGCVSDDPVDATAVLLRVTIDSCAPGTEDRATAVSIGSGLALTVAHSFDDAAAVAVIDVDDTELEAEVVYLDRSRDIALLAFDTATVGPDAQRGLAIHSDAESPADEARLVLFRSGDVVIRPVDLLQRTAITLDGEGRRESIKLGAEVEAGDSGAPVIDAENRIIGMVFATSRTGDTGWAIAGVELVAVQDRAGPPVDLPC